MIKKGSPTTALEEQVLSRIARGEDPWLGHLGGSRKISGAIGRLVKRGRLRYGHENGTGGKLGYWLVASDSESKDEELATLRASLATATATIEMLTAERDELLKDAAVEWRCPSCGDGLIPWQHADARSEIQRLTEERDELLAALEPLAHASKVSAVKPVYAIGTRFGAPYDERAAEAMVHRARAALAPKGD